MSTCVKHWDYNNNNIFIFIGENLYFILLFFIIMVFLYVGMSKNRVNMIMILH